MIFLTGNEYNLLDISVLGIMAIPCGLFRSDAILAIDLVSAIPIEIGKSSSSCTCF